MTTTLITGATGTVGNQIARLLLAQGASIKVATRDKARAEDLARKGAEVVELDLEDRDSVAAALEGIDRLFLVGPQGDAEFGEKVAPIMAAAKRAGVSYVLRLSAFGASPDGRFVLAKQHGIGERYVQQSGIDWTVLEPTFFQDNLIKYQGDAVRGQGAFYGASGQGKVSYISSADIARVAAAILSDPTAHVGKTYVLTGPEALSDREVAAIAHDVTGKAIEYVNLAPEVYGANLRNAGMPDWFVDSFLALEAVKRDGYATEVTSVVQDITGQPPESYRTFLQRQRNQLV